MSNSPSKQRGVHVVIRGRVQGVFFRASAQEQARALGVTGWIQNQSDGSVAAVFEGDQEAISQILSWCKVGSPSSRVDSVESKDIAYTGGFDRLETRY